MKDTDDMPYITPFFDVEDALQQYEERANKTDADRAIVIKYMVSLGLKNKDIRMHFGIKPNYIASRLMQAATLDDDELEIWRENQQNINLGHIRVLLGLKKTERLKKLKEMTNKKISVRQLLRWREGLQEGNVSKDQDTARYELLMSEHIHRQVKIKYNNIANKGSITLQFFGLNDLDDISKALGFDFNKANDEY